MPTRSILVRLFLALVLMGAFMVLADGMAQRQVQLAVNKAMAMPATVRAHPADAQRGE